MKLLPMQLLDIGSAMEVWLPGDVGWRAAMYAGSLEGVPMVLFTGGFRKTPSHYEVAAAGCAAADAHTHQHLTRYCITSKVCAQLIANRMHGCSYRPQQLY
jgi:hypothetical protein